MQVFKDGGLEQDGGTVDPASGNKVPVGSSKEEVRDDIPAMVSEGEFVFPADVVRFIGLERLMKMRQQAKSGLKMMEKMGQMSNDSSELPDDVPFNPEDIVAEDDEGNTGELVIVKAAEGQDIKKQTDVSKAYNKYMGGTGIQQELWINPQTGEEIVVYNAMGQMIPNPPPGFVRKGSEVAGEAAIQESVQTTPSEERSEREDSTTMFDGKIVPRGRSIDLTKDGADFVTKRGDDKLFGSFVNPKNAPAGWNTQNQFELEQLQEAGFSVKAMWNGQEWDVYSPDLDNTAFGTPGTRGFNPKYNMGQALKSGAEAFGKGTGVWGKGISFVKGLGKGNQQSYIDKLNKVAEDRRKQLKPESLRTSEERKQYLKTDKGKEGTVTRSEIAKRTNNLSGKNVDEKIAQAKDDKEKQRAIQKEQEDIRSVQDIARKELYKDTKDQETQAKVDRYTADKIKQGRSSGRWTGLSKGGTVKKKRGGLASKK